MRVNKYGNYLSPVTDVFLQSKDGPEKCLGLIDTGCVFGVVIPYNLFVKLKLRRIGFDLDASGANHVPLNIMLCDAQAVVCGHISTSHVYAFTSGDTVINEPFFTSEEAATIRTHITEHQRLNPDTPATPTVLVGTEAMVNHILTVELTENGVVRISPATALRKMLLRLLHK